MDTRASLGIWGGGQDWEDASVCNQVFPTWMIILLKDPRGEKRDEEAGCV